MRKLKAAEYLCSIADRALQGNFTRVVLIASFAGDDMTGFIYRGFRGGESLAAYHKECENVLEIVIE